MRFKHPPGIVCVSCGREAKRRKLCPACYVRERRAGNLDSFPPLSLTEYLDAIIDKSGECWIWLGTLKPDGYGVMRMEGVNIPAHRFMYEREYGPVLAGVIMRHTCDNRACVRPAHLLTGTQAENIQDAVERDRHCQGERHGMTSLTNEDIRAIRKDPRLPRVIAPEYSVSMGAIYDIKTGRSWGHLHFDDAPIKPPKRRKPKP